jgi:hypothetical protein
LAVIGEVRSGDLNEEILNNAGHWHGGMNDKFFMIDHLLNKLVEYKSIWGITNYELRITNYKLQITENQLRKMRNSQRRNNQANQGCVGTNLRVCPAIANAVGISKQTNRISFCECRHS